MPSFAVIADHTLPKSREEVGWCFMMTATAQVQPQPHCHDLPNGAAVMSRGVFWVVVMNGPACSGESVSVAPMLETERMRVFDRGDRFVQGREEKEGSGKVQGGHSVKVST